VTDAEPHAERILCDTSFVSPREAVALKKAGITDHWPQAVTDRLDQAVLAISVVTVAEVRSGRIAAKWGEVQTAKAEEQLAAYLRVPLDLEVLDRCVDLRAKKINNGWGLGDNDLWIAATAQARNWPLVACDLHFCDLRGELELIYLQARPDSPEECP
jgi:predicted nucleic acid-binding protein